MSAGDVVYTAEQRAAAAFAAGALRVAALVLRRSGFELEALRLFVEHDQLIEISGVTFARDAERAGTAPPHR